MTTEATTDTAAPAVDTTAAATPTTLTGQDTTDTGTTTTPPAAQAAGTTEQPAADAAKPAEAKPATEAPQGAPETYAEFTMPEGVTFDKDLGNELVSFAKEHNLTQEQAQKVADLGAKQAQTLTQRFAEAQKAQVAKWETDSKADKEFGGDQLNENLGVANKFLGTFATPEFKQLLVESGLGNHPEMIRMMVRVGKAISQDKFVAGGNASARSGTSMAERFYPDMKSKS